MYYLRPSLRHHIRLDDNAAGWGSFVDPTPWEDSEFTTPGNQGEPGKVDLLTGLSMLVRTFERPMDLAVVSCRLALGTRNAVWQLRNAPDIAPQVQMMRPESQQRKPGPSCAVWPSSHQRIAT